MFFTLDTQVDRLSLLSWERPRGYGDCLIAIYTQAYGIANVNTFKLSKKQKVTKENFTSRNLIS